jgi:nucleotide-binding universal stress UspA family protein
MTSRGGFRSLLIGIDGSRGSRHAVAFVARLAPPPGGRVTVLRVVERAHLPSLALLPGAVRGELAMQAAALHAARVRAASSDVERAAQILRRAGWRARGEVREGVPLSELLAAIGPAGADLLILGARGVGGVERFLLGSVADAATKHSPTSVLIVR